MRFTPFLMERWQSTYEHRVRHNLSESGVHPLALGELLPEEGQVEDLLASRLGYTQSNGTDELRSLIAALHPGATDAGVLATAGGAEANFVSFWELARTGGATAAMLPNYMQLPGLVECFGGRCIGFRLREENGWRPDLTELSSALEAGASCIVATHPNNPTGAALTAGEIDEIAALADRHGAWILADEVYQGAEVADDALPTFWGRYDKLLVTGSLSKAYGLPGLRLGWVAGPPEMVERLWARTDYTSIAPTAVSDMLARIALSPHMRRRLLARTQGIIRRNLEVVTQWAHSLGDRVAFTPPDAGAICLVRYRARIPSLELAERLRVEHSLLLVPGAHFGLEGTFRIGFGLPEEELTPALERVGELLRELD